MAHKIIWLPKAEQRYAEIINWLRENWSEKEIIKFVARTEQVIELIRTNPEMYRRSEKKDIRQVVVTKHNILLYRRKSNLIELINVSSTKRLPRLQGQLQCIAGVKFEI